MKRTGSRVALIVIVSVVGVALIVGGASIRPAPRKTTGFTVPHDRFFNQQWYLYSFGQKIGASFTAPEVGDIHAPEAWAITKGSPKVVVAVIDSGVTFDHPDLKDRYYLNPGETGQGREHNEIDDDHNGFVDDWRGWDFRENDNDPTENYLTNPHQFAHGTAVDSVIAAEENGIGMVGVAPKARILAVRTDYGGRETLAAIDYAVKQGARVVNMSYSSDSSEAALADIMKAHPDVLFVAAAGNDRLRDSNSLPYPCILRAPNLLCVAALSAGNHRSAFTNLNASLVHLGAPGSAILVAKPAEELAVDANFEESTPENAPGWFGTDQVWFSGKHSLWTRAASAGDSPSLDFAFVLQAPEISSCLLDYAVLNRMQRDDVLDVAVLGDDGAVVTSAQHTAPSSFGDWEQASIPLPKTEVRPTHVVFKEKKGGPSSFVAVDDIRLHCPSTTYTGREYMFSQGTSFSSPIVAGVGALLLSKYPTLSGADAARAMVETTQPIPALRDVTITGGAVDAAAALRRAKELAHG